MAVEREEKRISEERWSRRRGKECGLVTQRGGYRLTFPFEKSVIGDSLGINAVYKTENCSDRETYRNTLVVVVVVARRRCSSSNSRSAYARMYLDMRTKRRADQPEAAAAAAQHGRIKRRENH